ncbi:hypothetical protein PVAND_017671 [Polypedilum vanderplanki]|uniref:Transmembrane protein n=1 Tax=Polypedilum vanderplanki TaxID=319348 RepID=A0A9J6B8I2_POLVA|nr:hypothetical protein PVAND_017671 [Polypedilum vanderplanki]
MDFQNHSLTSVNSSISSKSFQKQFLKNSKNRNSTVVFAAIFACASAGVVPYAAWSLCCFRDHHCSIGNQSHNIHEAMLPYCCPHPTAHLVAAPAVSVMPLYCCPLSLLPLHIFAQVPAVVAHAPVG